MNTMWATAERAEFLGRTVLLQSVEYAFVTSLDHGFGYGTQGDVLQTIVDAASLLPVCKVRLLMPLLNQTDLLSACGRFAVDFGKGRSHRSGIDGLNSPIGEAAREG